MPQLKINLDLPDWGYQAYQSDLPYIVAHGGRASAKTTTMARIVVLKSLQRPIRGVCVREHMTNIEESLKESIVKAIHELNVDDFFDIQKYTIDNAAGSHMFFRGLSDITKRGVKGWEDLDFFFGDEMEYLTYGTHELLFPTFRKEGSQMFIVFNPRYRTDPIFQDFCVDTSPRLRESLVFKVNYADNPWFTQRSEIERRVFKEQYPERYPHVWLGEPDDQGGNPAVLPYALLERCVEAWPSSRPNDRSGRFHTGHDVADTGINAAASRRSAWLYDVSTRISDGVGKLAQTAAWAHNYNIEWQSAVYHYDSTGVGAGMESLIMLLGEIPYKVEAINFGSPVAGPKAFYIPGVLNKDHFLRRNAQLAYALKLRAQNTARWLDGEDVDPETCLFINPAIKNLEAVLAVMSQPEERDDLKSGKVDIDKSPNDAPSPHEFDAVCLAFAADSKEGLTIVEKSTDYVLPVTMQKQSVNAPFMSRW